MSTTPETPTDVYTEENLQLISGCEAIRLRPAMYIGCAGTRGLHCLVEELLRALKDDWNQGQCTTVDITFHLDGSCSIRDDGRAYSLERLPGSTLTEVEAQFTRLGVCGRVGAKDWQSIGGIVANALSDWLEVEIRTNGRRYGFAASRGVITSPLADLGSTDEHGTAITFHPDPEIFETATFDEGTLAERLQQLAFLHPGLRLSLEIERTGKRHEFHSLHGLADYLRALTKYEAPLHEAFHFQQMVGEVVIEVALQWCESHDVGVVRCFMNGDHAPLGGTPVYGLHRGVARGVKQFDPTRKLPDFHSDDFKDGLFAVIAIRHPDPMWEGATKSTVGNPELETLVARVVCQEVGDYLTMEDGLAQQVWEKCRLSQRARIAARTARARVRGARSPSS